MHVLKQLLLADNQALAGEKGAIEIIVEAMKNHTDNTDVCGYGCAAISSIVLNGKQSKAANNILNKCFWRW